MTQVCVNGGISRLAEPLKEREELKKKLAHNETALPPVTTSSPPIPGAPALADPNKHKQDLTMQLPEKES